LGSAAEGGPVTTWIDPVSAWAAGVRPRLRALRPRAGRAWKDWQSRDRRRAAVHLLTEAVQGIPGPEGLPDPRTWTVRRALPTETDVTVAVFGTEEAGDIAVGRLGEPGDLSPTVTRNSANVRRLLADGRLGALHPLLPAPLYDGWCAGRPFSVERALAGASAPLALGTQARLERVVQLGLASIDVLHSATAETAVVSEELLDQWTRPWLALFEGVGGELGRGSAGPLARLRAELSASLVGRPCTVAWTHGDLWAGNLLVDRPLTRVLGIVDWDAAHPRGLPVTDVLHLVLTARGTVEGVHFGDLVAAVVTRPAWGVWDRTVRSAAAASLPSIDDPLRAATLLTWLAHVGAVLAKQPTTVRDRWVQLNVEPVLRLL
jgi:hypothetical protein